MKLLATGGRILAARLGQVAAGALAGLLLARALEPVGFGHYQLTVAVIMLAAAVLNGGVGLAAVPPVRRAELAPRRALAAQLAWVAAAAAALALLLAAGAVSPLRAVAVRELGWTAGTAPLVGAAAVALLAFEVLFYDLLAVGRLLAGPLLNLARAAVHLLLIGSLVLVAGLGLASAVAAFAAAQLLAAVAAARLLRREPTAVAAPAHARGAPPAGATVGAAAAARAPFPPPGTPLPRLALALARRGWSGQLSAVISLLHLRLDLALVVWFRGPAEVGLYGLAVMVGELLWHLPGALNPILVHASAAPEGGAARDRLAARALRVGLLATAAAAVPLAVVAGPLLALVFGPAYAASAPALRALLPGIVVFAAGAVLAGDFIGRGRPVWNAQAGALTLLVNVACGLLLIPAHGAVGAAWASTIAYATGSAAMIARFRRASGLSLRAILLG